jgi:lipoprotein-releasing system permease protein
MFKPLEIFVGLRYTRAKRRNHFISFISLVSIGGIALGVTVMITVLSVMNGFVDEVRDRILSVASHMQISSARDGMQDWRQVLPYLEPYQQIKGVAPFIHAEGMLTAGAGVSGTMVRGISPEDEPKVSTLDKSMVIGSFSDLKPGEFNIILGQDLAHRLGVRPGDKVTLVTPQVSVTPVGVLPRLKRFTVTGVFEAGMYEYDSALALIHIEDAAKLFLHPGEVSGVRLKLDDLFDAPMLTQQLVKALPRGYLITDWTHQHVNLFHAVKTEKTMMFIILSLIVAVAVFNIVSTLVMVVTDKQADIAILRTLGASPGRIMRIFIVQGVVIGLFGTLLGLIFGLLLASNIEVIVPAIERLLGIKFMAPDVYYISELPSQIEAPDVLLVTLVSFTLSMLMTIYPAWRASRTQPAEALRYE